MDIDALKSDWAVWLALVPATLVALIVLNSLVRRSSGGQLRTALKDHGAAQKKLRRAKNKVEQATVKLEQMSQGSDKVRPRVLEDTRGMLEDSLALEKILDDKCQVTMNHLRRVIFEEFPPSCHEKLRQKYLPQDIEDGRPFSF